MSLEKSPVSSNTDYIDNLKIETTIDESSYSIPEEKNNKTSFFQNFKDSFKKADDDQYLDLSPNSSQLETTISANGNDENRKSKNQLLRNVKPRHLFMVGIGTGVGTGMLISTGSALRQAGPANLLIAFCIVSSFIFTTYNSIAELAVVYKDLSGSYNDMFKFLVDPGFAFATNFVYALNWLCVLPFELVASSLLIRYWTTSVNPDVFVACFYVLLMSINMFGGQGYAEFEFLISSIKLTAIVSFSIFALIKDVGGVKGEPYIGGKYWRDPGAFRGDNGINRFKGLCACFAFAGLSYGGFEAAVLLSSVVERPVAALKKGRKMLLYRIFVIYISLVIFIGLLVPHTSNKLLGGSADSDASPLIIAASNVKVYPHILNAVLVLAVLSVANNALYSASRVLHSMFSQFYPHPKLTYVDRRGRPLACLIIAAVFGLLCFLAAASFRVTFFNWLLSIASLSILFTYAGMNLAHIRFRKAMKYNNRSLNELAFIAKTGVWGSYWGVGIIIFIFIAQFWVALFPIGTAKADANNFFQNYLCVVAWLICYIGYKLYKREWKIFIPVEQIDIVSDRIIYDNSAIVEEEEEMNLRIKNAGYLKRIQHFWC
ncbi:high-affinity glutamine permease [Hanseniaspora valbyensis NRRL Y-1626]|uniref:High-affinity glutamine permease n=1 Tax=Hanseniaspora valbyensis NRRL Y-1626 TaxID=766949 RepID=A0A1B7TCF2_9ASCO|nr:high-affinity glutamine permease [Hanseniaspora valbyensis NRRL Y-1626]